MLSWEYPPGAVGGTAAHVVDLSRSLVRAGHEVVVLTVQPPGTVTDETVEGVRILRASVELPWLPGDDTVAQAASANHQIAKLRRLLGDWRPDVVHAHDWKVAWAADTLADLGRAPLIVTFHGTERGRHGGEVPPGAPSAVNSVEAWIAYRSAGIICLSDFMAEQVIDGFELPPSQVIRVPNGMSVERWAPDESSPAREQLVVAWGRVAYEKGFQVLAGAIGRLRHRVPGIRCVIAGRGPYLAELQVQIDVEGVGDLVQLAGFMPGHELRRLLHRAGCVAIPSLYEPYGFVALEAMAAGAPIVAARTGGLSEIIAGTDAGLLFSPGNRDELADLIADVLNSPDNAGRLQFEAGELLREHYSWGAVARQTLSAYQQVLAR
jgi:glycogen synthase